MKRIFVLFIFLTFPSVLMFTQNVQTFIDFNNFETEIQNVYTSPTNELATVNGRAVATIGANMFALDNWSILLTNSSGENPITQQESYTRSVVSEEQGTVLGVRVLFPEWPHAAEALIRPLLPLRPFTADGQYAHINNGVVTNVGSVKSFSLWVNGRNFAYTLGFRVRDLFGALTEFPLGSLLYIGWRKLSYDNPFFSARIPNNIEPLKRIYPSEVPLLGFDSFAVYRPDNQAGGNFVGYFGASEIEYTPYIVEMPTDIVDEQIWGIISEEQRRIAAAINSGLYEQLLQYEYARQRVDSITPQDNANQDAAQENINAEANNQNQDNQATDQQ